MSYLPFLLRAKSFRNLAFDNKGQDIRPENLLPTLLKDLTEAFGNPVLLKTPPTHGKLSSKAFAVTTGKSKVVLKLLANLDFSTSRVDSNGYAGGVRVETNGKQTIVNYCGLSGILCISTNLDVIDV